MNRKPNHRRQQTRGRRPLRAELLEDRRLLTSDSGAFFGFGSISASFAPDDTQIGFRANELHESFDALFGANQWQPVIERAFQTWARESEINIGFVEDSGAPAGVYGACRGDTRFGDIRIFGVALGEEIWAEAISEDARQAGTWAGDVIFNVAAGWRSLQDLETVALHEVGHILGLEHSDDPNSPMYAHGPSAGTTPTPDDLTLLQSLYGTRSPDPSEGDAGNDTLERAFRVRGNEVDGVPSNENFDGSQVWLQFGDLLNASDRDVFEIRVDQAYDGPLGVHLRTSGLSLAKLRVELLDRNGVVLATAAVDETFGGDADLQLANVSPGRKYYIRVSALDESFWAQGDYSVTIGDPNALSNEASEIALWGNLVHRWYFDSRGARAGFSYHLRNLGADGYGDDDEHTDDDDMDSRDLAPAMVTDARAVYTTVGSLSDLVDVDYLRFSTPATVPSGAKLLVDLQSLDANTLVPAVAVLNRDQQPLDAEYLSVGSGATQFLIHDITANQEYFIRLDSSGVAPEYRTGNYSLNLEVSAALQSNEVFASGRISDATPTIVKTLYVAIPQVVTFSLEASPVDGDMSATTQTRLQMFDERRRLIHNIVAPLGTMRSLPGVLLDVGEYYLQVSVASDAATLPQVDVRLSGTRPTDPIGPLVAPVDFRPIYTCETGGDFCYPDGTVSTQPSHVGPPPSKTLPPPPPDPVAPPPDSFFWANDLSFSTNQRNANDANGDGVVTIRDVLLVITYLERHGSGPYPAEFVGYLDTNADHVVSPRDVLLIVRELSV